MTTQLLEIRTPETATEIDAVRTLFLEYANSLGVDLCFQNFQAELDQLPGDYIAPRGALLTASSHDTLAGCCVLRPLDTVDYPNACEIKRLFVRPAFRGQGIGRLLAESVLNAAKRARYAYALLDTLTEMTAARSLYEELGFVEVAPYYLNPIDGAHYLMVKLEPMVSVS